MKVLYIGGTGEISYECLKLSAARGHQCTVFNRGQGAEPLPEGVVQIIGDMASAADFNRLSCKQFDVVCQFKAYTLDEAQRDLATFAGRCGQFVFISTATVYQKPPQHWRITEDTPLGNPYWDYSQRKLQIEQLLREAHGRGQLPLTIVRPSLTYRRNFPGTIVSGDDHAWRILQGKPVTVHGDGQALWTLTHARDFATLFVPLLGNPSALGEAFPVMTDTAFTWDLLFASMAYALEVAPKLVHVPTETLLHYNRQWTGPMLGDKAWTTLFDTAKINRVSRPVDQPVSIADGFKQVRAYFNRRMQTFKPDPALHELLDRIAKEQESLAAA